MTPAEQSRHAAEICALAPVVPVLVLVAIALPSISLLAKQYESPPEDAVTIELLGCVAPVPYWPENAVVSFRSKTNPRRPVTASTD